MTKKRPCTQSGFDKKKNSQTKILLKKALLNKNSAKKSPNIQKIEFWQAPND